MEHVLFNWSNGSKSPSWEPWDSVQKRFPSLLLEDKEAPNRGGVVTDALATTLDTPTSPSEMRHLLVTVQKGKYGTFNEDRGSSC